jgi:hypothetical protein
MGDHAGIAGIRKARARVAGKLSDYLALAAIDDDVGDGFRQVRAAGNGEQVILALCARNLDENLCRETAGFGQHAACHRDRVIPRQLLNDLRRSVVERRQARAELGPGPAFDAGDEQTQHIVKDLDLIAVEALSVIQEEICHLTKGVNPPLPRATPHGVFEFVDDGMNRLLHCRSGEACW